MGGVVEATDGPDQAWNSSDKGPTVIPPSGVHYVEVCTKKRDENGYGYHVIGVAAAEAALQSPEKNRGQHFWGLWLHGARKIHGES